MSICSQILAMKSTSNIPSFNKPARRTGSFTPAFPILALYDPVVRLMSRERTWRSALLLHLQPRENEVIVDVGCGTGSFMREIGRNAPGAHLIGTATGSISIYRGVKPNSG
ncbi:hypothetical protein D9M72_622440 [compost metagenome]